MFGIRRVALGALFVMSVGIAPVAAQDDVSFKAVEYAAQSDWRFERTPESCGAFRFFGFGDRRLRLSFTRYHPGGPTDIVLVGDDIDWRHGEIRTGVMPSSVIVTPDRVSRASWRKMEGIGFTGEFPPVSDEGDFEGLTGRDWLDRVTHFFVADASDDPVALETGSLVRPLAWIDDCMTKRLERLGIDTMGERGRSRDVEVVDFETWQKRLTRRFPFAALARNYEGPVPLRITVGEDGSALHCQALHQLTARILRDAACELILEFAQYRPALDAEGEPMVGYTFFTLIFDIKGTYERDGSRTYGDAGGRTVRKQGDY